MDQIKKQYKDILTELIWLQKQKLKQHMFNGVMLEAFKDCEKNFFIKWDKLKLPYRTQNTIFYVIGEYCDHKYKYCYENDILNVCYALISEAVKNE